MFQSCCCLAPDDSSLQTENLKFFSHHRIYEYILYYTTGFQICQEFFHKFSVFLFGSG